MELPKNITQIGEADAKCKIYVEDYVVSFLKQLNPLARDKTMAAALYGRRNTEEEKTYLFVYGAGKLDFIQRETRHLSQAQRQEIERIRKQYFADYEFLGYRLLDGEMVDGFHICEQDICRYISGYAQFYEKNEAMLSYMLESRQEEIPPESVDSEKYDMVKSRQERRRANFTEQQKKNTRRQRERAGRHPGASLKGFQAAAAAIFVLLCLLGISMNSSLLSGEGLDFAKLKAEFAERKLPDDTEASGTKLQIDTLQTQDKLSEAVQLENRLAAEAAKGENGEKKSEKASEGTGEINTAASETPEPEDHSSLPGTDADLGVEEETAGEQVPSQGAGEELSGGDIPQQAQEGQEDQTKSQETSGQAASPVTYIVCKGDTLTGISIRTYGTEKYVKQICSINEISNPDEIQIGQKILLP